MQALRTLAPARSRPSKARLESLFRETLARLGLDRVIPLQVQCEGGVLQVGGKRIDLRARRRVIVIAIGKAAYRMVDVLGEIIAPISMTGVVTGPSPVPREVPAFQCFRGGHPYPNADSLRSAEAVVEVLEGAGQDDFVLFLLSGGGSAICEKPLFDEIGLKDCAEMYQQLVTCGATVLDVNFVRKHFSAVKGGRLARLAQPARQMTLYVSDAPPGAPSNVASGPTMPDESNVPQCLSIIRRTGLARTFPATVRTRLANGSIPETPKEGDPAFRGASWHCLLSPEEAVEATASLCQAEGWVVETDLSIRDDCPRERAVTRLLNRLERVRSRSGDRPAVVVSGGEYSCPALGNGVGGRNQAFVLESARRIAGRNFTVLSAGTDGIDGTSPAAGAVADGRTLARAAARSLDPEDYLSRSDSFHFFARLGDVIVTGPTGNNVRDIRILAAW